MGHRNDRTKVCFACEFYCVVIYFSFFIENRKPEVAKDFPKFEESTNFNL